MMTLQSTQEQHLPLLEKAVQKYGAELATWLPWFQQLNDARLLRLWLKEREALHRGGQEHHLMVFWEGKLAGMLSLSRHDRRNRKAQLSYWLLPPFRGKGLVQQAASAIFKVAFQKWQLQRLGIETAAANAASLRSAQRLGFQEEGIERQGIRLHGRQQDLIKLGLLAATLPNILPKKDK